MTAKSRAPPDYFLMIPIGRRTQYPRTRRTGAIVSLPCARRKKPIAIETTPAPIHAALARENDRVGRPGLWSLAGVFSDFLAMSSRKLAAAFASVNGGTGASA